MNPSRILWFSAGMLKAGKVRGWLFWGLVITYVMLLSPSKLTKKLVRRMEALNDRRMKAWNKR